MVIGHVIIFLEFLAKPAVDLAVTFVSLEEMKGWDYSGQPQAVS